MFHKYTSVLIQALTLIKLFTHINGTLYLIPHSHDDLGWLKTIDQYYDETVRRILDKSILALEEEPSETPSHLKRKFVYSEIGFLKIWIEEDPNSSKEKINRIKKLIEFGKFEFVNGGMAMADNACPHYEDFINNFYSGLSYLERNFGARTQIAWQLDSFGQSHSFYYIAAKFRMTDAVFRRIPHQMKKIMAKHKLNQFSWKLPFGEQITAHIIEHYRGLETLNCDTNCGFFHFSNNQFLDEIAETSARFVGSGFSLYGDDFQWSMADYRWNWLEKNLADKLEIKIALFTEYLQKFEEENTPLYEITGDFFPYLERDFSSHHQAWTGYFTTKPSIKYAIKRNGMLLRAIKNLLTTNLMTRDFSHKIHMDVLEEIRDLSELNALLTHHDAITGTSKKFVDLDYYERMDFIEHRLIKLVKTILNKHFFTCDYTSMLGGQKACENLTDHIKYAGSVKVQILNPTMSPRQQYNIFYVAAEFMEHYAWVSNTANEYVPTNGICLKGMAYCMLIFKTELAKLPAKNEFILNFAGVSVLYNNLDSSRITHYSFYANITIEAPFYCKYQRTIGKSLVITSPLKVSFSNFEILFSKDRALFINLIDSNINNTIYFQKIRGNGGDAYAIGYYDNQSFEDYNENLSVEHFIGQFIEGALVVGSKLTYLIYKMIDKNYIQVDVITGHDREMNSFLDIILVIESSAIQNQNNEFYTESNGLFELKRKRVERPEDSIFPTTSKAALKDLDTNYGMSVFVDRARGVFGQNNQLHFYIQRTSMVGKGQPERLHQNENIFSKFYILNYRLGTENEIELDIRNQLDVETVHLFEKQYPNEIDPSIYEQKPVTENISLPSSLRYNTEMITEFSFLVRIQNIDRANKVDYDIGTFLHTSFNEYKAFEVDFAFVFSESIGYMRSIAPAYQIAPLQFLCFYLKKI